MSDLGLGGKHLPGRLMPILYDSYIRSGEEEFKVDIVEHCRRDVEAMPEIIDQFSDRLLK